MRLAAVVAGVTALLAALGALFEWFAAARVRRRFPPPGRLVDVGGYRLHLLERGAGDGPTVVLEAGLAGFSLDWGLVLPEIARCARVVAYDRAGYGWSERGPAPRTSERIAGELHTLLTRAAIPGPYILVGHSFGGYTLRLYADRYPDEVAALAFIETSHEDLLTRLPRLLAVALEAFDALSEGALNTLAALAVFGVPRLVGVLALRAGMMRSAPLLAPFCALPPGERPPAFALRFAPRYFHTCAREYHSYARSSEQAHGASGVGARPVVVVTAIGADAPRGGGATRPARRGPVERTRHAILTLSVALGSELAARLSTRSRQIITDASGHMVALTQPALVVEVVRELVEATRAAQCPTPVTSNQNTALADTPYTE